MLYVLFAFQLKMTFMLYGWAFSNLNDSHGHLSSVAWGWYWKLSPVIFVTYVLSHNTHFGL